MPPSAAVAAFRTVTPRGRTPNSLDARSATSPSTTTAAPRAWTSPASGSICASTWPSMIDTRSATMNGSRACVTATGSVGTLVGTLRHGPTLSRDRTARRGPQSPTGPRHDRDRDDPDPPVRSRGRHHGRSARVAGRPGRSQRTDGALRDGSPLTRDGRRRTTAYSCARVVTGQQTLRGLRSRCARRTMQRRSNTTATSAPAIGPTM